MARSLLSVRVALEPLEDRCLLSWDPVPPATLPAGAAGAAVSLDGLGDARGSAAITNREVDYSDLTAPLTGNYTIRATTPPQGSLDTVLGVYQAAWPRSRIAYNDNYGRSGTDSQVTVKLTAGQRVLFGITNRTGNPGGSYTWSVDGPVIDDRFENNDSHAQAYDLGQPTGTWWAQGLTLGDTADWFKFRQQGFGTAAHFVSAVFEHARGDLNLEVYRETSPGVLTLVGASRGTVNDERVSLEGVPPGSTIYVKVVGAAGAFNPDYALVIQPGQDDPYEDNDSLGHPALLGTLTEPTTLAGLQLLDAADYFQFTMTGFGDYLDTIRVNQRAPLFDSLEALLFDSSGRLVRSDTGLTPLVDLEGLPPGTYVAKVSAASAPYRALYDLTINPGTDDPFEENDTRPQAHDFGTLTDGVWFVDLALADSADWYRFNMTGFGYREAFARRVVVLFDPAQGDLEAHLYDGAGNDLGALTRSTTATGDIELDMRLKDLAPGGYYLEVRGVNSSLHPRYSLSIDPNRDDRYEDNDRLQTAYDLGSVDTNPTLSELHVEGELADDHDWYRFTLLDSPAADGTLAFTYVTWDGPLEVVLYDASGNRVSWNRRKREAADIFGMPGEFVSYSLAGLSEGTYYLRVSGAEVVRDNGDGTGYGTGVYGTWSPFYRIELDLNDDISNPFYT